MNASGSAGAFAPYSGSVQYPSYYVGQYDPATVKALIDLAKTITELAKAQVPILEAALAAVNSK